MTTAPSAPATDRTSFDTIVIGGGQAGLAVGYELQRRGRDFLILDAHARIGDAWRRRWDSLTLFTPSQFNGLPGLRYPAPDGTFCSKDEFADYLEHYARHFHLPVRTSTRVTRLSRPGARFVIQTDGPTYEADHVIVAMGSYGRPKVPPFARELDRSIVQLHSDEYRNPDQLQDGPVLLVGVGNSGADIAMEVVRTHDTWLAGEPSAVVPFRIESFLARHVLIRIVRFVGHRVLNVANPIGRKVKPAVLAKGTPLIRVKPADLEAAGVRRTGRIDAVRDGRPVTEDGQVLDVRNVIWCTGYKPAFSWIDLPILGDGGEPQHEDGVIPSVPGLHFVGLEFRRSETSGTITGVGRDARRTVRRLDRSARGVHLAGGGAAEPSSLSGVG